MFPSLTKYLLSRKPWPELGALLRVVSQQTSVSTVQLQFLYIFYSHIISFLGRIVRNVSKQFTRGKDGRTQHTWRSHSPSWWELHVAYNIRALFSCRKWQYVYNGVYTSQSYETRREDAFLLCSPTLSFRRNGLEVDISWKPSSIYLRTKMDIPSLHVTLRYILSTGKYI